MEEKETIHVQMLTELTGNLFSEESEWEENWSESDEYGMPLDGTELADYEDAIREELERYGEVTLFLLGKMNPEKQDMHSCEESMKKTGRDSRWSRPGVKKSTVFVFHLKEKQSELPYMKRVLMHWHT